MLFFDCISAMVNFEKTVLVPMEANVNRREKFSLRASRFFGANGGRLASMVRKRLHKASLSFYSLICLSDKQPCNLTVGLWSITSCRAIAFVIWNACPKEKQRIGQWQAAWQDNFHRLVRKKQIFRCWNRSACFLENKWL